MKEYIHSWKPSDLASGSKKVLFRFRDMAVWSWNCCSTKFYIVRFRFCSSALYFFRTFLRTFPPLFSTQNLAQSRGPAAYCGLRSVPGGRTLGRRLPGLIHRPAGQVPTQTPGAGENVISGKILSSEDTCMGKLTPPNLKEYRRLQRKRWLIQNKCCQWLQN